MPSPSPIVQYIELDVSQLDQPAVDTLVSTLVQCAKTSALVLATPALQASAAAIDAAHTDAKDAADVVNDLTSKLAAAKQTHHTALGTVLTTVVRHKGLVQTNAKTRADVVETGFTPLAKAKPDAVPAVPGVDIFFPKKGHGRAKVSAQETGTRKKYAAQVCTNLAQNTWADLKGNGRSHWLTTYPSGTTVWVRFATVQGHNQSDWSAPIAVTIP